MGEANRKSKRLAQFIERHPRCCFCGGYAPTESIDHVPSRQMFRLKKRPTGLELPACRKCNEDSAPHELVASLVARSMVTYQLTDEDKKEINKLLRAVDKNRHGLLDEMNPTWQQQYDYKNLDHPNKPSFGGIQNAKGPLLNKSMELFSAKMCLALYYEHTKKIVSASGGLIVRWYSNYDHMKGNIPQDILRKFKFNHTLKQGAWNVHEQFGYSYAIPPNSNLSAFSCYFNRAFMLFGFISLDKSVFENSNLTLYVPGEIF
jgi:hypothetical protein